MLVLWKLLLIYETKFFFLGKYSQPENGVESWTGVEFLNQAPYAQVQRGLFSTKSYHYQPKQQKHWLQKKSSIKKNAYFDRSY